MYLPDDSYLPLPTTFQTCNLDFLLMLLTFPLNTCYPPFLSPSFLPSYFHPDNTATGVEIGAYQYQVLCPKTLSLKGSLHVAAVLQHF